MRYSRWDQSAKNANDGAAPGHRLVTTVISQLGLDPYVVPFNESSNPLLYLRARNFYLNDITSQTRRPITPTPTPLRLRPTTPLGRSRTLLPVPRIRHSHGSSGTTSTRTVASRRICPLRRSSKRAISSRISGIGT